jgi:DnaD/phage-associated family protein
MNRFKGFTEGKTSQVQIPGEFFTKLLSDISDLDEVKVLLCIFHLLQIKNESVKYFYLDDLMENEVVKKCFPDEITLSSALKKAIEHQAVLAGQYDGRSIYFLNTAQSGGALRALQKGAWTPNNRRTFYQDSDEKPNLFTLYEKNIGPLTPILAETLEDAEKEYPADWIEDAITIAVKKNVRNWQYIEAILRSWKEKGRSEENRRDDQENPRRYIEGELADYIKH